MKIFKRIVILFWLAVPVNVLLSIVSPWYRHHGASGFEALIMLLALLLTAAYRMAKFYREGMSVAGAECFPRPGGGDQVTGWKRFLWNPKSAGPFGFVNAFDDSWIVTPRATKLFFASTIIALALIPMYLMYFIPETLVPAYLAPNAQVPSWMIVPYGALTLTIVLALFFIWGGMLRYWSHLDRSGKWMKRLWLAVLVLGVWWGACLYYYVVYLPQVQRRPMKQESNGSP